MWIQRWGDRGRRCILEGATAEDEGASPSWQKLQKHSDMEGPAPSPRQHPRKWRAAPSSRPSCHKANRLVNSLCLWKMSSEDELQVIQILWRPRQQTMGGQQRRVPLTAKRDRSWVAEWGAAFCQSGRGPYIQRMPEQPKEGGWGVSRFSVQRLFNKWMAGLVEKQI